MSDKKYAVPDGMLDVGIEAWRNGLNSDIPSTLVNHILEAAIRWQSENTPHPTDKEFGELIVSGSSSIGQERWEHSTEWMRAGILCHEWVRRMYLAPEPEVPVDEEKERFRVALEKLARFGNGAALGNSDGNIIAQEALRGDKPEAPPISPFSDGDNSHFPGKGYGATPTVSLDPEVPEAIKDLSTVGVPIGGKDENLVSFDKQIYKEIITESYRRGQKDGGK